jgi:hypothetical protein
MSITDTPTAPSPSKFDIAMQKATRLLAARAEIATLECDIRNVAFALSHEASRATTEDEKRELRRQHQALRRALAGHL